MGKVRRLENEKERDGREMYFCKLAPHKSDTQSSREKAVKNGVCAQTQARANAGSRGKRRGTGQENEEQCIEKRQKDFWGAFYLDFKFAINACPVYFMLSSPQAEPVCLTSKD